MEGLGVGVEPQGFMVAEPGGLEAVGREGAHLYWSSQVDQLWDGGECDVRARRWMGSSAGVLVTAWTVEGHDGQERRFHGFPGF